VTSTPELINDLVECAAPVRRLRPPLVRACLWLAFAGLVVALLAIWRGPRSDLALRLDDPVFVLSVTAALLTGILAAIAAFAISLPDRSKWWLALPVPALAAWLSTVSYGCLTEWVSIGPDGIHPGESLQCLAILMLTSVPLSLALGAMLRYAALLRPGAVAMTGALAVAALSSSALSLLHDHNATVMVLVENLGSAAVITGAGGLLGRRLSRWAAPRLQTLPTGGASSQA
jgi:hypothetical protein